MPPDLLVQFKNPVKRPVETPYGGFLFRCYSRALPRMFKASPPALYPLPLVPSPGLSRARVSDLPERIALSLAPR